MRIFFLLSIISFYSCSNIKSVETSYYDVDEAYQVYLTYFIEHLKESNEGRIVFRDSTEFTSPPGFLELNEIDDKTLDNYFQENKIPIIINVKKFAELKNDVIILNLFNYNAEKFAIEYPKSNYYSLSKVGFNDTKRQAIFCLYTRGSVFGRTELIITLEKQNNKWSIIKTYSSDYL